MAHAAPSTGPLASLSQAAPSWPQPLERRPRNIARGRRRESSGSRSCQSNSTLSGALATARCTPRAPAEVISGPLGFGPLECILPGKVLSTSPPGSRRSRLRASGHSSPEPPVCGGLVLPQSPEERAEDGSLAEAVATVEPPPMPGVPGEADISFAGAVSCGPPTPRARRTRAAATWFPSSSSTTRPADDTSCPATTRRPLSAFGANWQQLQPQQPRGRRAWRQEQGGGVSDPPAGPTSVDVERLIARCMTHERPAALVQANAALLDACSMRLGEEAPDGEKRSDKIRRMLRLTDELRRYNADLTEQCVPTEPDTGVSEESARGISIAWPAPKRQSSSREDDKTRGRR